MSFTHLSISTYDRLHTAKMSTSVNGCRGLTIHPQTVYGLLLSLQLFRILDVDHFNLTFTVRNNDQSIFSDVHYEQIQTILLLVSVHIPPQIYTQNEYLAAYQTLTDQN